MSKREAARSSLAGTGTGAGTGAGVGLVLEGHSRAVDASSFGVESEDDYEEEDGDGLPLARPHVSDSRTADVSGMEMREGEYIGSRTDGQVAGGRVEHSWDDAAYPSTSQPTDSDVVDAVRATRIDGL